MNIKRLTGVALLLTLSGMSALFHALDGNQTHAPGLAAASMSGVPGFLASDRAPSPGRASVRVAAVDRARSSAAAHSPTKTKTGNLARQIGNYLRSSFGSSDYALPWYGAINRVSVVGSSVHVQIKDAPDLTPEDAATGACSGVSGFIFSNENRALGLESIVVYDTKGRLLILRAGEASSCAALPAKVK